MASKLSDIEIKKRLQQLRNVTMLHAKARDRIASLEGVIVEKNILLAARDARIAELETALADKESQRRELAAKIFKARKDTKADLSLRTGSSRKPGGQDGHVSHRRPDPPESDVTDRAVFDLSVCPSCKGSVGDVVDTVEKYQEDIDLAPRNKIVRHYTITRHWCPGCQEYVRPVNTPAQNLRRFGSNIVGYILYARYRLRLPLLKIQESLKDLHAFEISEGEIQNQLDDVRDSFGEQYDLICELIRTARVVYADESGWRMDGDNWYLWAFVDRQSGAIRYEIAETRGGGVAKEALGDKQNRVIVSDGYAVYNNLTGSNQQCWVHLLRTAKAKSQTIYGELCCIYTALLLELEKPPPNRDKHRIEVALQTIATKDYTKKQRTEPLIPKVQARIAKHHDQLLICLDHTDVLPENNTAERAIRPQVILRKIFGGSRSADGAKTHAVNASVIATKLAQNKGRGFFDVMLPVLREVL
jgi:hypothetical protein